MVRSPSQGGPGGKEIEGIDQSSKTSTGLMAPPVTA